MHKPVTATTQSIAAVMAFGLLALACSPGGGPEPIPLPTSPDTTTTTSTTTTTTTTTTITPAPTTTSDVPASAYEAEIRTTTDGVAHISGRTRADLAFGQGYVSATDYGCTLLDQILKIRGERSRFIGPGGSGENIESDFGWRAIDIVGLAETDFPAASKKVRNQYEGFAAGWNQHLEDADGDLSGWCADAEWIRAVEPVEVYAYARSIALLASSANFVESIAAAQPPTPAESDADPAPQLEPDFSDLAYDEFSSNAWAIGEDRIRGGNGAALVANPHSPWEGELRFVETQLTVPGEIDIYGAQLAGLPGIGLGFTEGVAWSHTTSAGHRYTAYTLDLDPASPTTYFVDGEPRSMTPTDHTVEILRPDGTVDAESRTLYRSEYGPMIDVPGVGWSDATALSYRDANIDNAEFVELYADLLDVESLADLRKTQATHQGVPFFNTVAVDAEGDVWYADTSATPNLSAEAELLYAQQRFADEGLARVAFDQGVILLDGSDGAFRWEAVDGARAPGLVPFSEQPSVERTDYVFNASNSFWVPSDEFTIDGDFSVLQGEQDTPLSMSTRQSALVLSTADPLGLANDNGKFSAKALRTAVFDNTAQTAYLLRRPVVKACRASPLVEVDEILFDDGTSALPAETVDLTKACEALARWDGRYDLDSEGAVLWRETMARFSEDDFTEAGTLFSEPFDIARPTATPSGFTGDASAVLEALARAVQTVTKVGFDVDTTLGSAQFTERTGERIPLHGGTTNDGTTNVVSWSDRGTAGEEAPTRGELITPNGDLRGNGYPVNQGTSFVMVVDFSRSTPRARALLTYGNTGIRDTEDFTVQTVRYSEKDWRNVAFSDGQIRADPNLVTLTVSKS